jgi:hypothetical protein
MNPMTPCDGSGTAVARPANDLPPGILNSGVPMTRDSHAAGKHSGLANLGTRPGEKSRTAVADEIRRRLHDPARDVKYK